MEISIRHKNKHGDVCGARHLIDDELLGLAVDPVGLVVTEFRAVAQEIIDFANSGERPDPELKAEMEFVCALKCFCDLPSEVAYFDDRDLADTFVNDRKKADEDWTVFHRYK